jgi:acetyl-CoA acetyltransferase
VDQVAGLKLPKKVSILGERDNAHAGLSIDAFEVNEAFASAVLAWLRKTGAYPNRLGGAVALSRPVGASGGRLLANLIATLEESGGRFGLQTMCESGGRANATPIERL